MTKERRPEPPTKKQITETVVKLQKLKKTLPAFSMFGDPNHRQIDAQIDILERRILSEEEIWTRQSEFGSDECGASDVCQAFEYLQGNIEQDELVS